MMCASFVIKDLPTETEQHCFWVAPGGIILGKTVHRGKEKENVDIDVPEDGPKMAIHSFLFFSNM